MSERKQLLSVCRGIGLGLAIVLSLPTFAQSGPTNLNVTGALYLPSGSPVTQSGVNFRLEIWDKSSTCLLYTEQHLNEDLSQTKGGFSLAVGKGTSAQNYIDGNSVLSSKVFENYGVQASVGPSCPAGANFASGDERVIRVSYDLGGGFVAMSPDVPIASSAYAVVAETLQGKRPSDFVQLRDDGTHDLNQANVENVFSSTNYARLQELLAPTSPIPFSGVRLTGVADPSAAQDAATKNYTDTKLAGQTIDLVDVAPGFGGGKVLTWDQAANKWVAMAQNISGTAGGDLTGTYPNPSIANLAIGTSKIQDNAISSAKIQTTGLAANRLLITDATTGATVTYKTCGSDEILKFTTGVGWECASIATYSAVTSVNTKTGAVVLTGADLGLGSASMRNIGIGASNVPDLDGSGKLAASTIPNFAGDVTGSYTNAFVARLQGQPISATAPNTNEVLKWNGSRWEPTLLTDNVGITALNGDVTAAGTGLVSATIVNNAITTPKVFATPGANRLVATDNTSGATLVPFVCNLDETMKWTASGWGCITVGNLLGNQFIVDGGNARGAAINIGTSDNNDLRLITNGQARISIGNTGYVGIGTTAPSYLIDANAASTSSQRIAITTDGAGASFMATAYSSNGSQINSLAFSRARGTLASPLPVSTTVRLGTINFQGYNGSAFAASASIDAHPTETYSTSAQGSYIIFQTTQTGTTAKKERMRIGDAGNVGIGTTTPARPLHVAGPVRIDPTALPSSPAAGDLAFDSAASNTLKFHNGTSWQTVGTSSATGDINNGGNAFGTPISIGSNDNQSLRFQTNATDRLFIGDTGNVGIGTTTPAARLDIAANSAATSGSAIALSSYLTANPTGTSSASYLNYLGAGVASGNSQSLSSTWIYGAYTDAWHDGTGTLGHAVGASVNATKASTGPISDARGLEINISNNNATGAITNAYGLRINTFGTTGAITNKWGVYVEESSAKNYFGGNVGIGTTSPSRSLEVAGPIRVAPTALPGTPGAGDIAIDSGAGNALKYHNGTSWVSIGSGAGDFMANGSVPMTGNLNLNGQWLTGDGGNEGIFVDANGKVGLGTSNPAFRLDLTGTDEDAKFAIQNLNSTSGRYPGLLISNYMGTANSGLPVILTYNRRGNSGAPLAVQSGDGLGVIQFSGGSDSSYGILPGASISAFAEQNFSASAAGTALILQTTPLGATASTEKMRISANGNVGIGTTLPNRLLEVAGPIRVAPATLPGTPSAGDIAIDSGAANALKYHNGTSWVSLGSGSGDFMANGSVSMTGNLRLNNHWLSNDGDPEGISIDNSGNVGIGATSPDAKLTVTSDNNSYAIANLYGYNSSNNAYVRIYNDQASSPSNSGFVLSSNAGANYVVYNFPNDQFQFITHGGNTPLVIQNAGNVGIGTTAPNRLLDVAGPIRIRPAALPGSPAAGDMVFDSAASNALKYHNGTSWVTVGAGSLTGSGTTNYLSKFTSASTLGNSVIYESGGNVGLGTTNPSARLHLVTDGSFIAEGAVGAGSTISVSGAGSRMIWNPRKAAFRAGQAQSNEWDDANVGSSSFASGYGTTASGANSVAMGFGATASNLNTMALGYNASSTAQYSIAIGTATASGTSAIAIGNGVTASGTASLAMGSNTTADSMYQTTIGRFNLPTGSESASSWNTNDPLFVVGNGVGTGTSRSNALMILKNGNVGIGITSPARILHTSGPIRISPTVLPGSPAAGDIAIDSSGNALKFHNGTSWQTVGTSSATGDFMANGSVPMTGNIRLNNNWLSGDGGSEGVFVDANGNVGIGTTAPSRALDVTGDQSVTGYLRVGSASAPVNTTAGDLTATRLSVGNSTLGSSGLGVIAALSGTSTDTASGSVVGTGVTFTLSPASSSASTFRSFNMSNYINTASNFTASGSNGISAGWFENRIVNAGTLNTVNGLTSNGLLAGSAAASMGTVSTVNGGLFIGINSFSNSLASTVQNVHGVQILDNTNAGTGPLTINNSSGLTIQEQTKATSNSNFLIGTSSIPSGNYSIYNASTRNNYIAGNVGIGTTSPSRLLQVAGAMKLTPIGMPSSPTAGDIFVDSGGANALKYYNGSAWVSVGSGSGDFMASGTVPMTGQFRSIAGTAGAPGMSFTGDVDNGIFAPAADNVAIATSGTEKLRVLSNGNVGIGTTTPASRLTVNGTNAVGWSTSMVTFDSIDNTAGTSSLILRNASGSPITNFRGDGTTLLGINGGYVGIGTTNPGDLLTVGAYETPATTTNQDKTIGIYGAGAAYFRGRDITNDIEFVMGTSIVGESFSGSITNHDYSLRTNNLNRITIKSNGNVGVGTTAPTTSLEVSSSAWPTLRVSSNTANGGTLSLKSSTKEWQAYLTTNDLRFWDGSDRVTFQSGGNVGIGTTAPSRLLQVAGAMKLSPVSMPGSPTAGDIFIDSGGANGLKYYNGSAWVSVGSGSGDFMASGTVPMAGQFRSIAGTASAPGMSFTGDLDNGIFAPTADNVAIATSGTEKLRVLSNGNVGIGTTTPSALLDVKGMLSIAPSGTVNDNNYNGGLTITKPTASGQYINLVRVATTPWSIGMIYNTSNFAIGVGQGTDSNFTSPSFVITPGGNVGIGITNPSVALDVLGDIEYTGTITDVSDKRLKENIVQIDGGLEMLRRLPVYSYTMKGDEKKKTEYGVMAQDLRSLVPDLTSIIDPKQGYIGVNYIGLIPWSIRAIQEIDREVASVKAENADLKTRVEKLEEQNKFLSEQVQKLIEIHQKSGQK